MTDQPRIARQLHNRPRELWLKRLRRWRRRHPSWGAPKLRWALRRRFGDKGLPSESAISRWLKAWGLTRPRRRTSPKGPVVVRPKLTEPKGPNEVWTADFKGWFRTGDGTRVEPLTVRDLGSRYALAIDLLGQQNVQDSRPCFERLFRQNGLPGVIRTDNGSPFGSTGALGLTRLSAWWVKLGIRSKMGRMSSFIGSIRQRPCSGRRRVCMRKNFAAKSGGSNTTRIVRMRPCRCGCRLSCTAKAAARCHGK